MVVGMVVGMVADLNVTVAAMNEKAAVLTVVLLILTEMVVVLIAGGLTVVVLTAGDLMAAVLTVGDLTAVVDAAEVQSIETAMIVQEAVPAPRLLHEDVMTALVVTAGTIIAQIGGHFRHLV